MKGIYNTFAIGLFLLAGFATSARADTLPPGVTKLDTAGIQKYIVGNTVSGFSRGKAYEEFYAPDGMIRGNFNGSQYSARWTVRPGDGWMCFTYKDPSVGGCWFAAVMLSANQVPSEVYWLKSDGSLDGKTPLKQGNPDGL